MSDALGDIFKRAKQGKILFEDRKALTSGYLPKHLPFRDKQIAQLAEVLAPALHHSKPSNILLYGKTGTGKTAVARHVANRLQDQSDGTVLTIYVNTATTKTEYQTLREISVNLKVEDEVPLTGLSISEVMSRIQDAIKKKGLGVILILDEIDYLVSSSGHDILYDFTRSAERTSPGFLSLVGISNNLQFKEGLDPRVLSSLGEEEFVFPPYTTEELRSILGERAKAAFRPGAVPDSTINLCAALAASEHGDARRALDLLRIAGEVAEREGHQRVEEESLRKASAKVDLNRIEEALRSLPLQNKIIILAASKFASGTNTGELYIAYSNLAKKSKVEVLTQRRVSGIIAELDMLGLLEAAIVSKGRRGRTKRIKLLVDEDTLGRMFGEDADMLDLL